MTVETGPERVSVHVVVPATAGAKMVPLAKAKGFESNRARTKSETTEADTISLVRFATKAGQSLRLYHT